MGTVKVIVSDYRYFLFTIYDVRFTQITDSEQLTTDWTSINANFRWEFSKYFYRSSKRREGAALPSRIAFAPLRLCVRESVQIREIRV
jgi:hypothetical protein